MSDLTQEKIEILPVTLLDEHRSLVNSLKQVARSLGIELGWHYLLDLTWIISQLNDVRGQRILDAGAGMGLMQWFLALEGAEVLSVDRSSRADLPLRYRNRFRVRGLRTQDLMPTRQLLRATISNRGRLRKDLSSLMHPGQSSGSVIIYNQDLKHLADIPNNTQDAIVAVSALEHNTPEGLEQVVTELMRVLKPGGKLLATLCAGRDEDWWHTASSGWCYTDTSLRRIFRLGDQAPSNYDRYDQLLADLRSCAELRDNLASFYSRSGDNGMPWGKWDPQYQPVGVCKVKPAA